MKATTPFEAAQRLRWRCLRCTAEDIPFTVDGSACRECGATTEFAQGLVTTAPGFAPAGFPSERLPVLEEVDDDRHFWAGPRRDLLERRLTRALAGGGGRRVGAALDLGCGLGVFARRLSRLAEHVVGVDGHAAALRDAAARDPDIVWVQADVARTPFAGRQFDVITLLDVLEHAEPAPLLSEIARLLAPGGLLLVSVPAFPALWSALDESAGHRCRYTRSTLRREIEAAGLAWESSTHFQMTLFPLLWWARRVARVAPRRQRSPTAAAAAILRAVNATEVRLGSRAALPWGTSLIAEARAA
jgi:SAM-dependent methyltransferase